MKIKINKHKGGNTKAYNATSANPLRPFHIIHPETRKPCTVMARPSGRITKLGEALFEVILPYTPRERMFGRRKGKLQPSAQAHSLLMCESKLRNLTLSKNEAEKFLKRRIAA